MYYTHSDYFRSVRAPEAGLSYDGGKRYYKLIDAQKSAIRMYLPHEEKGKAMYNHHTLYPNTRYSTYIDDPVFMDALRKATAEVKYTEEGQAALDRLGIEYELKLCKACGGRVKKLKYCPVEVIHETD